MVLTKGHVLFYNQRQRMEKEIQKLKTVLVGIKHKRKRSFDRIQALALLTLASNLELVWFRRKLRLEHLELKCLIRDVLKTSGFVDLSRLRLRVGLIT